MPAGFRVGITGIHDTNERFIVMDPNFTDIVLRVYIRCLIRFQEQILSSGIKVTPDFMDATCLSRILLKLIELELTFNKEDTPRDILTDNFASQIYQVLAVQQLWIESNYGKTYHLVSEFELVLEDLKRLISDKNMTRIEKEYVAPCRTALAL